MMIKFVGKKYENLKTAKEIADTRLRDIIKELDTDCIKDGQSYYLRYEFFNLLEMLDSNGFEYDKRKMFRLFDKLNYKVVKAYKCTKFN